MTQQETGWPVAREALSFLAVNLLRWIDRGMVDHNGFGEIETWDHPDGTTSCGSGTLLGLLTGNGMLEIIAKMQERGWRAHFYANGDYMAAFQRDADEYAPDDFITFAQRTGLTLPSAVAEAAYAALQERV